MLFNIQGSFKRKPEKWYKSDLMQTWIQHNYINLQCSPHNVLHPPPSSVPLRYKFLRRRSLLVAVPASHTLPPLPPRSIWSDVHVESLLGTERDENRWVPNLINMAVGGNTSNLNPEFAARYEGRALARCRHTPEDNKPRRFLRIVDSSWFRRTSLYLSLFNVWLCSRYCSRIKLSLAVPFCELCTMFPFFMWMTFVMTTVTDEEYSFWRPHYAIFYSQLSLNVFLGSMLPNAP